MQLICVTQSRDYDSATHKKTKLVLAARREKRNEMYFLGLQLVLRRCCWSASHGSQEREQWLTLPSQHRHPLSLRILTNEPQTLIWSPDPAPLDREHSTSIADTLHKTRHA